MSRYCSTLLVLALAIFLGPVGVAGAQTSLDGILTPYLARYDLPALAAAVVQDGKIVARGAVGTRRAGAAIPVTIEDRFHLGSDTKAMTALLAAMLVEENKLRWDSTVAEVFPEFAATMTPVLRGVTLEQLLSHTSGIPSDNQAFGKLLARSLSQEGNLDEMRYWLVRQWSKKPLAAKPGTKFAYANMNYVLVGAMLERLTGKTWDELITERIFMPLGLETAGLGAPSSLGRIDAPLGHVKVEGKTKAFLAGPNSDNPSISDPPASPICPCLISPPGPLGMPVKANAVRPWSVRKPYGSCIPRLSLSRTSRGPNQGLLNRGSMPLGGGKLQLPGPPAAS